MGTKGRRCHGRDSVSRVCGRRLAWVEVRGLVSGFETKRAMLVSVLQVVSVWFWI